MYTGGMEWFTEHADGSIRAWNSTITGDVRAGADSSFWFGAVVRGDVAPVTIGRRVNVQDNAVIHCDTDVPNHIEDDVIIGHGAVVHGMRVGAGSLIGMGATVLSRTKIGKECLIAAGARLLWVPHRRGATLGCLFVVRRLSWVSLRRRATVVGRVRVGRGWSHSSPRPWVLRGGPAATRRPFLAGT